LREGQGDVEKTEKNGGAGNKIKNSTSDINLAVDVKDKKHETFHRDERECN